MRYALMLVALLSASAGNSQNEMDILRYSQQEVSGTLRNLGMGGTMGAVGADLSCAFSNPAGLGLYRRGDVGFNWGFAGASTRLTYGGLSQRGNASNAPVTNAGIAITYPSVDPDWPFVTLAIAYQKRAELHQQILAQGAVIDGSLADLFLNQADGLLPSQLNAFTSAPAWNSFLLDGDPSVPACETCYVSAMEGAGGALTSKRIDREGSVGETAISFAANYRHRLYLGGSVGLPRIVFSEQTLHEEQPLSDSLALNRWNFNERLDIEGSGVNLRIGAIWSVSSWMRVGVNYATRSRLSLRDTYSTDLTTQWNDGTTLESSSPLNQHEYLIYTPSRLAVNAAIILGKYGVIAAEYERTDYRQGELRPAAFSGPSAYDYETENEVAQGLYSISHTARVGAEFRIANNHRVRLGAGMSPSPYGSDTETPNATRYHGSLGWAYRGETWYGGASYALSIWEENLYPWGIPSDPARLARQNGVFTIGVGARL